MEVTMMKNKNLPSGTRDEFGSEAEIKETIENKLFKTFRQRGFRKLTTPVLEYSDVFQPLSAENYRPYQLLDDQGESLVLRPDLTLPVARVMSTTGIELPVKWYYGGDVFRVKKQLSGGYNQLTQAGIEIVGYKGIKADWECLEIALTGCQEMAIDDVTIELSHAKFVDTLIDQLALPKPTKDSIKTALFEKNLSKYNQLLRPLEKTAFGRFLSEWPWLFGSFDEVMTVLGTLPEVEALQSIINDLQATRQFIKGLFPKVNVTLDLSIPSPQTYYTGMAFRGFTEKSAGYLFSGGRYDDLLTNFQNVKTAAVGVAFDVDALVERTPVSPSQPKTLVFFDTDQWAEAEKALKTIPNSTLCLTSSLDAAKKLAAGTNSRLIDLTESR
jgi:ATP phosphoribosyltransferase regulatory subunit